jgi:hypothetical protein
VAPSPLVSTHESASGSLADGCRPSRSSEEVAYCAKLPLLGGEPRGGIPSGAEECLSKRRHTAQQQPIRVKAARRRS